MASEEEKLNPLDPRRRFGNRGEDLAAAFFIQKGFRVIDRNWSCKLGEIDLILERGGVMHFIEVKTRRTDTYGYPEGAITRKKLTALRRAIEAYLESRANPPKEYQAGALAIMLLEGKEPDFHYIETIF